MAVGLQISGEMTLGRKVFKRYNGKRIDGFKGEHDGIKLTKEILSKEDCLSCA